MAPPIVTATIQTAIISAISNILAQAITAHQTGAPLSIDPIPVFQYALYSLLSTPPNFLWQDFLESTFPAHGPSASQAAPAAGSEDKATKDPAAAAAAAGAKPRLNKRNTAIKTLLDQTAGMAVNTLLFSLFMHGIRQGMAHHYAAARPGSGSGGLGFLLGGDAVRYGDVAWAGVWAKAKGEFWDLAKAGWRFWPLVSLVNYVFVTGVEARSLVGALAGLGWGIYLSLVTSQ
ncbi:hypothetical protein VTH06DRAFT_4425 [Thermothelomyces fergusii]